MSRIILASTILLLSISMTAQDSTVVRDLETWSKIGVEKRLLNNKLTLGLSQSFRFDNNSSSLDHFFTQFSGEFKLMKGLKLGAGYRLIRDGSKGDFDKEHRFQADLSYKHKLDRLTLSYRLRYTNRSLRDITVAQGDYNTSKYRLRVKAAYNIKNWKLDPYLSGELFYAKGYHTVSYVENILEGYDISDFQKYRITLGTRYKTGKIGTLGMFYRLERQVASFPFSYNATTWNIIGLNYTFKLK